ncbi:MAG: F0F1 ATP synthase subunit gamma [Candidatus Omnitrophica bacterium]|nr:F0F1 ATP synthase subunit gamma [Candidatus Omnitrophota bacterium]
MLSAGKLKSNLYFNKNLGNLIEVMKLAATLQFNQFRLKQGPSDEFTRYFDNLFGILLSAGIESRLLKPDEDLPALLILISSDEGFLGELNNLLVDKLISTKRRGDIIACVGDQGVNYLRELGIEFTFFESPGDKIDSDSSGALRDYAMAQYAGKKAGRVYIVYPKFINIISQQAVAEALLPLPGDSYTGRRHIPNLLIEPDFDSVMAGWMKIWLEFKFYQVLWSSRLSELAARIMHLEGSVQELKKINNRMDIEYFKYRHALSDKTIRELTATRLINRENDDG